MEINKMGICKICGIETKTFFNIDFKAINVCDKCALLITKQEVSSWKLSSQLK